MKPNCDVGTTANLEQGIIQKDFTIKVTGETIPCAIWEPCKDIVPRILLAVGHGGAQHKKTPDIRDRAIRYARDYGWATLAIDAPGHGERITREEAESEHLKIEARVKGDENAPSLSVDDKIKFLDEIATQAVPEWQAALDTVLEHFVPSVDSIGYLGVSQGTWIGVPLLAVEKRFKCAVLGLSQLHPEHTAFRNAAQHITIPLRFSFQWDDPIRTREYGIALYNAFASTDKAMHINPGGHANIPPSEIQSWDTFFQKYLG